MSKQVAPLVSGSLPVVGHALDFWRDPVALVARGHREHGAIFSLAMLHQRVTVLVGPEHNRFFFQETDRRLSMRDGYPFLLDLLGDNFFFMAEPDDYERQKALILPLFQRMAIGRYVDDMVDETGALFRRLGGVGEFDLVPTLGRLVMDIAIRSFLGRDFHSRFGTEFFEHFTALGRGLNPVLPIWLPIPRFIRARSAKHTIRRAIADLVQARRAAALDPPDFFQTLVDGRYPDGRPVPTEDIISLVQLLIWAGHENVTGHLAWTLIYLLQHPSAFDAVRAELDCVLARGEMTMEAVKQLGAIERALKETERIRPMAYALLRGAKEALSVGEYHIPAGDMVMIAPSISHRLPALFSQPEAYRPDRHAEKCPPYSLVGFGGGVHKCTGIHYAYTKMMIIVARLLGRYDLSLVDRDPQPAGINQRPRSPCRIAYRSRAGSA